MVARRESTRYSCHSEASAGGSHWKIRKKRQASYCKPSFGRSIVVLKVSNQKVKLDLCIPTKRYLFTNIAFVIQIRQPQEQKILCFDSQWGSGWHINDNKWRQQYLPYRSSPNPKHEIINGEWSLPALISGVIRSDSLIFRCYLASHGIANSGLIFNA